MKPASYLVPALFACTIPAFSAVTVNSPGNGASVISPFAVSATATACSSQPIRSMGYSIDNSNSTTVVSGASISVKVTSPSGAHTLHVKSWGNKGASCVTDVPIKVMATSVAAIPPNATAVTQIQSLPNWTAAKDNGTGVGTSSGTTTIVSSPSRSGSGREFLTNYTNAAGERYFVQFGADRAADNFLYDVWVYLASPSNDISKLEFVMNQVIPNGQTVIYGVRCNGVAGTWDYTKNAGTPQKYSDVWVSSTAACNPRSWTDNVWHHVQISYSRDDLGNVKYGSVWLDGAGQDLNVTVPSSFALGWGSTLITNFQVDGLGASGSATVYLDNLTIYRWDNLVDSALALVPAGATAVGKLQTSPNWKALHDAGTNGNSTGTTALVSAPSQSGSAREFITNFTNSGGELYHLSFGTGAVATNFLYDAWVYLATPSSGIANIEMDMNQVMPNGQTVIYGFQCDGYSGTWDYTRNIGTPLLYQGQWVHSKAPCNPRLWSEDTWHHVQISYSRDSVGNVTYRSVWLDDVEQDINATVPSAYALDWGSTLLTNFQVDGLGAVGKAVVYLDNLTVYRW
jgi:hypothetical protein